MDEPSDPTTNTWLSLVLKLSQCSRQMRRALGERAAGHGLSDSDSLALWACQQAGNAGQPQHDLATQMGVSPAQLSGLLDGLGERGLLIGRRPSHDRRRQYWRITPVGAELLARLLADLSAWCRPLADSFPNEARRQLEEQLSRLTTAVADAATPSVTSHRQEAA